MKKIGIFICHCGRNIAAAVNIEKVLKEIGESADISLCEDYKYMCSEPGQNLIKQRIKEKKLEGVIVACCSPSLHEETFRRAAETSGLNRFEVEIANIREQCSWVHTDRNKATEKAIKIIKSIIEKTKLDEKIIPNKIAIKPKALVIGAGIAGIQASLDIANSGYEVILVEKSPSIGGHMAQLSETFPTLDCSQCILTPKMVEVAQNENINLLTNSKITEVSGNVGNFSIKINKKARYIDEDACTGCGDCWNSCPVKNSPQLASFPKYSEQIDAINLKKLNQIIKPYLNRNSTLIQVLQDINLEYNYLPEFALEYTSQIFNVPLSEIYHIATFYNSFCLEPRGEHIIKVCMGTACHARGAPRILEEFQRRLEIRTGETTSDNHFTLQTVNCLGCCALGPVVTIDDDYYTVKVSDVKKILIRYKN